jgi:hypothetical protein
LWTVRDAAFLPSSGGIVDMWATPPPRIRDRLSFRTTRAGGCLSRGVDHFRTPRPCLGSPFP